MAKYKRKLAVVEAEQFKIDEKNPPKVGSKLAGLTVAQDGQGFHSSLGGERVVPGDWIVQDVSGVRVVSNEVFHSLYEPTK